MSNHDEAGPNAAVVQADAVPDRAQSRSAVRNRYQSAKRRKTAVVVVALSLVCVPLGSSPAGASVTWPGGTVQVCANTTSGCELVVSGPSSGMTVKVVLEGWHTILPAIDPSNLTLNPVDSAVIVNVWWLKAEPDYQASGDCRQGLAPTLLGGRTSLGSIMTSTAGNAVLTPVTVPPSGSAAPGLYWVCATTATEVGASGFSSAQPFVVR